MHYSYTTEHNLSQGAGVIRRTSEILLFLDMTQYHVVGKVSEIPLDQAKPRFSIVVVKWLNTRIVSRLEYRIHQTHPRQAYVERIFDVMLTDQTRLCAMILMNTAVCIVQTMTTSTTTRNSRAHVNILQILRRRDDGYVISTSISKSLDVVT